MSKIPYNHKAIEKKWRDKWEENPVNVQFDENGKKKEKYYCLDMFPYPSGNGLHVGHWRGYVISDVWSRYKLMHGYYVIHPMGWDAFGLPAENFAIKTGQHPRISTEQNINNIKRQIKEISAVYDWDMELNTTDPDFYKWTQWIFVQMFKNGLAYEKEMPINWCPSCKTGLSNEEVVDGKCERCGAEVTKKNLKQWMLRITKYADRLLEDLDTLDWPEKVKKMQSEWIGRSYGAEVDFKVDGTDKSLTVYTTRPDTLFGATYMVVAPEHKLIEEFASKITNLDEIKEIVDGYKKRYHKNPNLEVIIYGRQEMMISKFSLNSLYNNDNLFLKDRYKKLYPVKEKKHLMYIYNSQILNMNKINFYKLGINSIRYNIFDENDIKNINL